MTGSLIVKAMVAALLLPLASCVSTGVGGRMDPATVREIGDRKAASMASWKGRTIGGSDAFTYIHARMGYLLAGKTMVEMKVGRGETMLDVHSRSPFEVGSAVAVTSDGYYLTAAHCVKLSPLKLIGYNDKMIILGDEARVVWTGDENGLDLAIVHINARSLMHFPMADPSEVHRGMGILSGGVGGLRQNVSGGEILGVRADEQDGVRWISIAHTTPLVKGDSGGPIIDARGRLMGINSTGGAFTLRVFGKPWIDARRGMSVWADPDWIMSLIERDREKHAKS
jgi:S1-C subfamily serine protease